MALAIGTLDVGSLYAANNLTVAQVGVPVVAGMLKQDLAAHNLLMQDTVGAMAKPTTERVVPYGGARGGEMIEADEYGRVPTQKISGQSFAGLPLRKYQYALGWTEEFMLRKTPQELQTQQDAIKDAHMRAMTRDFKRALFLSTNYDWTDMFKDNMTLPVKRLANADGSIIPLGPNGETFDGSTHTHYTASSGLTAAALKAVADNVVEHGYSANVQVVINKADEATVRGFATTDFQPYTDPRIAYRVTDTTAKTLDLSRTDNRAIGILVKTGAEVWVKPWAIANYAVAWDAGAAEKPLAFRQDPSPGLQGLYIAAQFNAFPLTAEWMQAYFGFGVVNRLCAAVGYFGGATYTDPTIS